MELIALFGALLGGAALVGWGYGDEEVEIDQTASGEGLVDDVLPSLLDDDAPLALTIGGDMEVEVASDGSVASGGETVLAFPGLTQAEAADRLLALDAAGAFGA